MTYEQIKKHPEVNALLKRGNHNLGVLGYTDHSMSHCALVAERAGHILQVLGYSEREVELAKIAGCMHDIGNAINRTHHAETGAILANEILKETDMPMEDRIAVISAIGNHDESTGGAKDAVSAALILDFAPPARGMPPRTPGSPSSAVRSLRSIFFSNLEM